MKKIKASECSNLRMVAGNEKRFSKVIQGNDVMEWVGIGWIRIRTATAADRRKLKTVL